jgi:RimJ/RimL family protein N-acetyltransferase/catechol 2,3-dioxygenase-like lactoylglutathione lyase family enzyme
MEADPDVHTYDSDTGAAGSVAETERRLEHQLLANGGASWAIRLHGEAVGTIGIFADQGTTVRGVGWSLARALWRQGITSEAARVVVPYLLHQPGVDGLEAWVDSRNLGSLGVARAAGMSERARLPRVYRDHVAQTVVMARAATTLDPEVFAVHPTLPVTDLDSTVRVLSEVLGLREAWSFPDPPTVVFLAVDRWSGSAGLQIRAVTGRVAPVELTFPVGVSADVIHARALDAGVEVVDAPADKPWYRREFSFRLGDGHLMTVSGPSSPDRT